MLVHILSLKKPADFLMNKNLTITFPSLMKDDKNQESESLRGGGLCLER